MHEKLVRSEIPRIIEEETKQIPRYRFATPQEMPQLLRKKLSEEVGELGIALEEGSLEDIIGEIADVSEVLHAAGIDANEARSASSTVEATRQLKKAERGGFEEGIIMKFRS